MLMTHKLREQLNSIRTAAEEGLPTTLKVFALHQVRMILRCAEDFPSRASLANQIEMTAEAVSSILHTWPPSEAKAAARRAKPATRAVPKLRLSKRASGIVASRSKA